MKRPHFKEVLCFFLLNSVNLASATLINLQELQGTPQRYVQLLLASTAGAKQQPMPDFHQQLMQTHPAAASISCDVLMQTAEMPHQAEPSTSQMQEWHVQFASQCEHHILPFHGVAHIAVLHSADAAKMTLDHIKSIVLSYSHRLQIQERLTNQLADAVHVASGGLGTVVTCEAAHMCMVARGVEKHASSTITLASRGLAARDPSLRAKLLLQLSHKQV